MNRTYEHTLGGRRPAGTPAPVTDDNIDDISRELTEKLLAGESVHIAGVERTHADVMLYLHENNDDSDELESALISLQTASGDQHQFIVGRVNKIVARAADDYVSSLRAEIKHDEEQRRFELLGEMLAEQFHNDASYHL